MSAVYRGHKNKEGITALRPGKGEKTRIGHRHYGNPFYLPRKATKKQVQEAVDNYMAWLALTSSLTVVGHPVLALPCGLDEQGTPFGIQVIGQMYADHKLLSAGASIERFFGTHSELARPIPNFEVLSKFNSSCRSLGKLV